MGRHSRTIALGSVFVVVLAEPALGASCNTDVVAVNAGCKLVGAVPFAEILGHISVIVDQNIVIGSSLGQLVFGIGTR